MKTKKLVEIARSFSYKHNLGNYQSCDFFCSQKAEVLEEEAEETSKNLYQFCKKEVIKSLNDYLQVQVDMTGKHSEVEYAKGFEAGWKEAKNPPKRGTDPDEKKEVMAEMQMDAKSETPF